MITFYAIVLSLISIFLILLVLVQRGRGGGLTGALGGMGGQSAFGTKAGDTFTRVTIVAAAVWILTSILAVLQAQKSAEGPLGSPEALLPSRSAATSDSPTPEGPVAPADSSPMPLEGGTAEENAEGSAAP